MPTTVSLSDYDAAKEAAKRTLLSGGLLVYPTDTLYGLGCSALSESAVARLRKAKGRDSAKPLSAIVADYPMLREYCEVSAAQEKILYALLPGPYTFILPLRRALPVSGSMELGVRVPEHMFMRQLSRECNFPVVSTSANLSGGKGASEVSGIDARLAALADLVIDGGKCSYAQGSTIIDLIRMKVLRRGAMRSGDRIEW